MVSAKTLDTNRRKTQGAVVNISSQLLGGIRACDQSHPRPLHQTTTTTAAHIPYPLRTDAFWLRFAEK